MKEHRSRFQRNVIIALFILILLLAAAAAAQSVSPELLNGLKWRLIGPFRGGRVVAVSGVAGRLYYLLFWRGQWRHLEDDRCRVCLDSGL